MRETDNSHTDAAGLSDTDVSRILSEHYVPCEEGGRWYRCQRKTDADGPCNRKVFHPSGVVAHENYHQIAAGGDSILDYNPTVSDDTSGEGVPDSLEEDDTELLEEIKAEVSKSE